MCVGCSFVLRICRARARTELGRLHLLGVGEGGMAWFPRRGLAWLMGTKKWDQEAQTDQARSRVPQS